jgi:hypothetical protein
MSTLVILISCFLKAESAPEGMKEYGYPQERNGFTTGNKEEPIDTVSEQNHTNHETCETKA